MREARGFEVAVWRFTLVWYRIVLVMRYWIRARFSRGVLEYSCDHVWSCIDDMHSGFETTPRNRHGCAGAPSPTPAR